MGPLILEPLEIPESVSFCHRSMAPESVRGAVPQDVQVTDSP